MDKHTKTMVILNVIQACSREGNEEFRLTKLESMKNNKFDTATRNKISLVLELCDKFEKEVRVDSPVPAQ